MFLYVDRIAIIQAQGCVISCDIIIMLLFRIFDSYRMRFHYYHVIDNLNPISMCLEFNVIFLNVIINLLEIDSRIILGISPCESTQRTHFLQGQGQQMRYIRI